MHCSLEIYSVFRIITCVGESGMKNKYLTMGIIGPLTALSQQPDLP